MTAFHQSTVTERGLKIGKAWHCFKALTGLAQQGQDREPAFFSLQKRAVFQPSERRCYKLSRF